MENHVKNLCIICRHSFLKISIKRRFGSDSAAVVILNEFCKNVLSSSSKGKGAAAAAAAAAADDDDSIKTLKTWSTILDNINFAACPDCLSTIDKLSKARCKVRESEDRVRKLQMKILKEMKELQSRIGHFYFEMMNIERVLNNSLEDDDDEEEKNGLGGLDDIESFRGHILNAANDLRGFRTKLSSKLLFTSSSSSRRTPIMATKVKRTLQPEEEEEEKSTTPVVVSVSYPNVKVEPPDDDDDDEGPEDSFPEDNIIDPIPNNNGEDNSNVLSSPTEDNDNNNDVSGSPSDSDNEDEEALLTFTPMSRWKKRLITCINRVGRKQYYTEGGILDPRKKYPMRYNFSTDRAKVGPVGILINENEKVVRCSRCHFQIGENKQKTLRLSIGRTLYNHVLGKHLNVFTCRVTANCRQRFATYEQLKAHAKKRHAAHHAINTHHYHHEAEATTTSRRNNNNPSFYDCDACGKRINSLLSFRCHKWTHLNEEEKMALDSAIKEGSAPENCPIPSWKLQQIRQKGNKNNKQKVPCPTCRKLYWKHHLREHELTHIPIGERETVMCGKCGKNVLASSERHHRRNCVGQ